MKLHARSGDAEPKLTLLVTFTRQTFIPLPVRGNIVPFPAPGKPLGEILIQFCEDEKEIPVGTCEALSEELPGKISVVMLPPFRINGFKVIP